MESYFILPIAKTDNGCYLMDKIYSKLYPVDVEKKANRFDENLVHTVLFMIHNYTPYNKHIRILRISNQIRDLCTIAYNDKLEE